MTTSGNWAMDETATYHGIGRAKGIHDDPAGPVLIGAIVRIKGTDLEQMTGAAIDHAQPILNFRDAFGGYDTLSIAMVPADTWEAETPEDDE